MILFQIGQLESSETLLVKHFMLSYFPHIKGQENAAIASMESSVLLE
jgi:hypothetical protein